MKHKLTNLSADQLKPGRNKSDGDGLTLNCYPDSRKAWTLRYLSPTTGRPREAGLGAYPTVSIAGARLKAEAARALLRNGIDPIDAKKTERQARKAALAPPPAPEPVMLFAEAAEKCVASLERGWKGGEEAQHWRSHLRDYVNPVIGQRPIAEIGRKDILAVLEQELDDGDLWSTMPSAATVRMRLERILDFARAREWREGENPARWKGGLKAILPAPGKLHRTEHHAALPWQEVGAFMAALREQTGIGVKPLELLILTGCRSSEVRRAVWGEVDLNRTLWVIPAERMKSNREHRVPLSDPALAILRGLRKDQPADAYIFPAQRRGQAPSKDAFTEVLKNMGQTGVTIHGFRSTFKDWCSEATAFPYEVSEAALAHSVGGVTERAYARSDLFEKRRRLMADWAEFCARPAPQGAEVTRLFG